MAWIELRDSIATNKKTMRLKRILKCGTAEAVGHMCLLWLWAVENAPSGDLSDFYPQEIAEAAHWDASRAEDFVDALQQVGYIDEDGKLHDWGMYAGDRADFESVRIAGDLLDNYNSTNVSKYVSECVILSILSKLNNESLTYIYNYLNNILYLGGILTHSLTHKRKDYIIRNPYDSALRLNTSKSDVCIDNTDITRAREKEREKESLRNFVGKISNEYLGRDPIPADFTMIFDEMHLKQEDELTDDQCFLLETAYKQAWKANKGIPYVRGCLRNFEKRGIKTKNDYMMFSEPDSNAQASEEFYIAALKASIKG